MKNFMLSLMTLCIYALTVSPCNAEDKKVDPAAKFAKEPSSGKAINEKAQTTVTDRTTNPEFSAEQRGWEKILAENLGGFYYPLYIKSKARGSITAWDYVKDDPALPRILIIGDSISRGCTVPVRNALKGKVNVHRAPANCGPTHYGLQKLDVWLGDDSWDLVVFNFGIHDRRTKTEEYTANLEKLLARIKPRTKKIMWYTSTPVPEGANEYVEGSIDRLNGVATPLMKSHKVPVIDLHAYIQPKIGEYQLPKNCHFKGEGYEYMGAFIAENILKQLAARN
ncbi:MAG: SGNH/GDSL hydrolase family protein [Kiritimatiellae bacterium]|nr:SGNH/GDSL hydrolase family protein [Kiritimatiellia bacterium]